MKEISLAASERTENNSNDFRLNLQHLRAPACQCARDEEHRDEKGDREEEDEHENEHVVAHRAEHAEVNRPSHGVPADFSGEELQSKTF